MNCSFLFIRDEVMMLKMYPQTDFCGAYTDSRRKPFILWTLYPIKMRSLQIGLKQARSVCFPASSTN